MILCQKFSSSKYIFLNLLFFHLLDKGVLDASGKLLFLQQLHSGLSFLGIDTVPSWQEEWHLVQCQFSGCPPQMLNSIPLRVGISIPASNSQTPARYLTVQLRHLLGDSVRLHRLRTQSHKTVLHFRGQSQVEVVTCPTGSKSEVPLTPSLGLINLPEWLFQLNKHVFSLDYQFITKDIKGYESIERWSDA